jgi:hypothetical protein
MKGFISQMLYILLLLVTVCACSDRVDINRVIYMRTYCILHY